MNEEAQNSRAAKVPFTRLAQGYKRLILRSLAALVISAVLLVTGYSIYVAEHEPDPQETVILGQTDLSAGSPAAIRILVRNRVSGQPVPNATISIHLSGNFGKAAETIKLGTFHTDATGTLPETLEIPDVPVGDYELVLDAVSTLGRDHVVKKVNVQSPVRILLSLDKPIYQPGQVIHLKSLMLNSRTQKPAAQETVTFEVSDAKGNKVFKESRKSSAYGIAAADFELATELNLGRYEIRALAGANTTERTAEVKPYVLPKFKIRLSTDKSYYLPGETVAGFVQADYFFGQPVSGGTVKLTAQTFEAAPVVISELAGRTSDTGRFNFKFTLPKTLVGLPQFRRQGLVDVQAEVMDTARHTEKQILSLPVGQSELEINALPETGALVPGVENLVYILTSYPDGRPAACKVIVNNAAAVTDSQGIGTIKLTPVAANEELYVQAWDDSGKTASLTYKAEAPAEAPSLLLRTDKAVYQAGQTAQITLLSPEADNTVFIDVIKEGQTVLTKSVPLMKHQANYELNLPAELTGTLKINAYMISDAGEDRGCTRIIYVNPGSALHIAARMSKPVYRPGEVAKLDFAVTDARGNPAPGALGLAVVDESVFALSENRPGLLQQFLSAEGELLKPRYEIKSFGDPGELLQEAEQNQALGQAYFSSLGPPPKEAESTAELVKNGYIPQQMLDHIRSLRGTADYESFRNDPEYAGIFRQIEGEQGLYNLRVATGPDKVRTAKARRNAYFDKLGHFLGMSLLAVLFILPFWLIIRSSRRGMGLLLELPGGSGAAQYYEVAIMVYRLTAALVMFPMLFYPLAAILADRWRFEFSGWTLLAIETVVLLSVMAYQFSQLARMPGEGLKQETDRLRSFLGAFLFQFMLSRGVIVLLIMNRGEDIVVFWLLASLIMPLIVLGKFSTHIRRRLAAHGITDRLPGVSALEILVIVTCLFILSGMLLPALASAKRKAQRINLVNDLKEMEIANRMAADDGVNPGSENGPAPHLRHDFPETLFWRPELITDDQGKATLEMPLADSITTWRASVEAINAAGKMGSMELPVPVKQDFFVDLDLPVSLSLGDQVSIPVTCYNYLKEPQDVRLKLEAAAWFEAPITNWMARLEPGEVKSMNIPIRVMRVGNQTLRVTAHGRTAADAVEREVQVVPTGTRVEHTHNGVLKQDEEDSLMIPAGAIPDSASLLVRFYPSHFSEIVAGLDSLLQEPYGCFEQSSSVTYPNVLVLDYLKRTGQLKPEVEIPARKFINDGYQRLLTFEVPGGGFEWFGRSPANICLTAYGILEFTDMARVHPVDAAVLERSRNWLYAQQSGGGSWAEAERSEIWSGYGSITAFTAWALAESGDQSANLDKALIYLQTHPEELSTTYAKALAAIAFLDRNHEDAFGQRLVEELKRAAIKDGPGMIHWTSQGYSVTYSHGSGMEMECTALCAMALMKAGYSPESVKQALTWISSHKFADGTMGSTQATILAMRALIQGTDVAIGQDFDSAVTVFLNGVKMETFHINRDNSDVMKQIELTQHLHLGNNRIKLQQTPPGELSYQIAGAFWLPEVPSDKAAFTNEALQIEVRYNRTTLPVNDLLKSVVIVKNNSGRLINMAMVDLGIPPGFDVDTTAFEGLQESGKIEKFEVTGNQLILYLRQLPADAPFQFDYSLRAKYPLRAQTPPSTVYEYYQPQNRAQSQPVTLQVVDR